VVNGVFLAWYAWSGRMRLHRMWLGLGLLVAPFGWALGLLFLLDFVHSFPKPGEQVVNGKVVSRAMLQSAWGIQRPVLTIQVEGTNDMVKAELSANALKDLPDDVTFSYSGDPSREVFLQQETNPIWGALFLLLLPALGVAFLLYVERQRPEVKNQRSE